MDTYIENFIPPRSDLLQEMEAYASDNHVPIMSLVGIEALLQVLAIQQPSSILEIGTAIGYSALRMAEKIPNVTITTIERDEERAEVAKRYVERASKNDHIEVIVGDALDIDPTVFSDSFYDAIFIDAAKGQYRAFFDKYSALLAPGGVIYCDNMLMHGLTTSTLEEVPKRKRTMIRKLKEFTTFIMTHPEFDSAFLPVGDGIIISRKKERL
ncbi:O-methyltransferase [Paenisporosarcina cavernae]|uniref:O-methyltransferase n=1 Tax=Paenisporosarcina cavernae TaxID=2320858 RepID=UPI0026C6BFD4